MVSALLRALAFVMMQRTLHAASVSPITLLCRRHPPCLTPTQR